MSTAARSAGFIGPGHLGFGMAGTLFTAGHGVLAYDVVAKPLVRFAACGGRAARKAGYQALHLEREGAIDGLTRLDGAGGARR